MRFEPMTIEHLGLKLYSILPPVIGELISNAWDAEAERVEIILPKGDIKEDSEVIVRDFGKYAGMDADVLQDGYLPIGRNCRDELERDFTEHFKRALMGRKGIGKLSAFGVATELEVRTIKNGNAICLLLNYDHMKAWPKDKLYEPIIVKSRTGPTKEENGTEIHLRKLHRITPIDEDSLRKGIAKRFTVIDTKFKVIVNGKEITPADRKLRKECRVNGSWDVKDILSVGTVVDETKKWFVSGWVGLVEKSSQTERGIDVFVRGKAAELETMFGLKTTHAQYARSYVVGEIHADFLDAIDDNISTSRNSIHWESEPGQKLEQWGQKVLKFLFEEWILLQRKEKEDKIVRTADFEKWLSMRTPREQKIALKLIRDIVDDPNIEPEAAAPLLNIIKSNIEFEAFRELVDELDEKGLDAQTFLKLFADWRIIEAREHLKLSDGRMEVIDKLSEYIEEGALEVKQIQPLFEKEGWLVNPKWTRVTGQTPYTKLLRENCKEPKDIKESDRRIDILGYDAGGSLCVVELKRPEKTLSRKDLEQIESYVDWARNHILGSGPNSPKYANGILIVGNLNSDGAIRDKQLRLQGYDIRVETYRDLENTARKIFGEVEQSLKEVAPEYSREGRKKRKN